MIWLLPGGVLACLAAYVAGRSVYWHRALSRMMCAAIFLWAVFCAFLIANGRTAGEEASVLLIIPPLAVVITAAAVRWIFAPLFPRVPFSSWIALRAAFRRRSRS